MYLWDYSKNGINKDEKIIILIIKEILKLFIDRKSRTKVLITSKFTIQAFKTFKKSSKKLKEKRSLSKDEEKHCTHYYNNNYNSSSY